MKYSEPKYLEYIPFSDEPDEVNGQELTTKFRIYLTNRRHLKRQIWKHNVLKLRHMH